MYHKFLYPFSIIKNHIKQQREFIQKTKQHLNKTVTAECVEVKTMFPY